MLFITAGAARQVHAVPYLPKQTEQCSMPLGSGLPRQNMQKLLSAILLLERRTHTIACAKQLLAWIISFWSHPSKPAIGWCIPLININISFVKSL